MELFGIGIWEVLLVVLIALIVLGPQDTVKAGRSLGRAVRRIFSSEEWRTLLQASREIRTIPDKLLEETGLDHPEEILPSEAEIRKEAGLDDLQQNLAEWNADLETMRKTGQAPTEAQTGQILPPRQEPSPTASPSGTGARAAVPQNPEPDIPEMKADVTAWGNSTVLIPTPQISAVPAVQPPAVSGQTPTSAASGLAPEATEPASPPADKPEPEPSGQEPDPSISPKQEQK